MTDEYSRTFPLSLVTFPEPQHLLPVPLRCPQHTQTVAAFFAEEIPNTSKSCLQNIPYHQTLLLQNLPQEKQGMPSFGINKFYQVFVRMRSGEIPVHLENQVS